MVPKVRSTPIIRAIMQGESLCLDACSFVIRGSTNEKGHYTTIGIVPMAHLGDTEGFATIIVQEANHGTVHPTFACEND